MNVRYFVYLTFGLTRVYPPQDRGRARETTETLVEPQGSKICRHNIVALSTMLAVAGFAGADPRELNMFGIRPSGDWG